MKIKVTKTSIDQNKLDTTIDRFDENPPVIPYLIMNNDTAVILSEELGKTFFHQVVSGPLGMYRGCKVLIDNSLEFGEVDVR